MSTKKTISKQKAIEIIADMLFSGKKRKDIIQELTDLYKCCESFVDKCIKVSKTIVEDRIKDQEAHTRSLIREGREDMIKRLGLQEEAILAEYQKVAFFNIKDMYNEDNTLKQVKDFDNDSAAAIGGIEVLEQFSGVGEQRIKIGETTKLKLIDKIKALDSIRATLGYAAPTKVANTDPDGNKLDQNLTNIIVMPPSNTDEFEIKEGE
jgi:hypothetical protein